MSLSDSIILVWSPEFHIKDSYFSVSGPDLIRHDLSIKFTFRPLPSQIRQYFLHSHLRFFIASRHISFHMKIHLENLLPTLPGFIHVHTVMILCMQEFRSFASSQHDDSHFKCQIFSCNYQFHVPSLSEHFIFWWCSFFLIHTDTPFSEKLCKYDIKLPQINSFYLGKFMFRRKE